MCEANNKVAGESLHGAWRCNGYYEVAVAALLISLGRQRRAPLATRGGAESQNGSERWRN